MNQIVKSSKLDEYRVQVLPPERARDLYASLPAHIKPAVFERNLVNALMANPSLMDYDPRLIFREVSKAAGLGLLLDPLLGEAYIVTAYNYKTKKVEPQLRVGYKGMNKLARQSGNVAGIYAHEVHALDDVECDLGFPKVFHHKPRLFGDRGDIIGYVALIAFKDGTFDFEPMSVKQCLDIRDRSDAWKAFTDGKIKSTPWATDEAEMSKKTVLRRLMKRQDQSPELVGALKIEDEAEFVDAHSFVPEVPRLRVPSPSEIEQAKEHEPQPEPKPTEPKPDPISTGKPKEPEWADYDAFVTGAIKHIHAIEDGGELETYYAKEIKPRLGKILGPDLIDIDRAYSDRQQELNADE
jgi:recombination protein RecT